MGEVFFHAGLAVRVFDALDAVFGGIKGRLSYLCVTSWHHLRDVDGHQHGQRRNDGLDAGPGNESPGATKAKCRSAPILGSGGLAMIIPPSALAVLLGKLGADRYWRLVARRNRARAGVGPFVYRV